MLLKICINILYCASDNITLISSLNSHLREKHNTLGLRFIGVFSYLEREGMGFKRKLQLGSIQGPRSRGGLLKRRSRATMWQFCLGPLKPPLGDILKDFSFMQFIRLHLTISFPLTQGPIPHMDSSLQR